MTASIHYLSNRVERKRGEAERRGVAMAIMLVTGAGKRNSIIERKGEYTG